MALTKRQKRLIDELVNYMREASKFMGKYH